MAGGSPCIPNRVMARTICTSSAVPSNITASGRTPRATRYAASLSRSSGGSATLGGDLGRRSPVYLLMPAEALPEGTKRVVFAVPAYGPAASTCKPAALYPCDSWGFPRLAVFHAGDGEARPPPRPMPDKIPVYLAATPPMLQCSP